jgi:hypothetical protein
MTRCISLFILFCLPLISFSKTTATSNKSKYKHQNNKKYPATTLEFIIATEQTKNEETHKVNGTYNKLDSSLMHSIDKDNDIRLFASAIYQQFDNTKLENNIRMDLAEFMYRRKNLLSQSKHGVNLDLELKNYYIVDQDTRKLYGFDGAFIPQIVMKRKLGSKLIVTLKLRHQFFFKNNANDSTLSEETRVYLTPTYILSRKLFLSSTFKYRHKIYNNNYFSYRYFKNMPKYYESLTSHIGALYLLNKKLLVESYVETKLMTSLEDQALNKNWDKNFVLGAALYITAF